ncbi:transcriptional regulator, ArsR family protein [Stappia aggregata IAM 12614]|uniref:Transcriptional regulator, ArsR family protein n=1 Tax=Roseibium aggregatum (strain ATCC 25650 / DSM 13394 / JCM 20685 / NBRC 16684 / NCIMB 2208 / IAM 12614 / B1) TaxID=384765 RepID=A0P4B0_ROSAI|nr:metalloregulator ArsR/SmtB family transcription factor [Roseibium aggregatum]EAV40135.1 transcriptional regulator, ArsR family protein [Stappia aggregata IAM 12614] [Roseibium aggregatum IAM 12614]
MDHPADHIFRTLADPTRRRLFEHLCIEGEQTVVALTKRAGVSQPAVSKHLAILKKCGLVSGQIAGRETRYSAQTKALVPLVDWTRRMSGFWESKLDSLEDLLGKMDQ